MRSVVILAQLAVLLASVSAHAADIRWAAAVSGTFADSTKWEGGVVPGAADTAILDATGAAYTVNLGASRTLGALVVASADATALVQGSSVNGNVTTTVQGGVTVGPGALVLESANLAFASSLTANGTGLAVGANGTFRVSRGSGGPRNITGDMTSAGTVEIQFAATFTTTNGTITNDGVWLVQDSVDGQTATLTVNGPGQRFVQRAGTLTVPAGAPATSFGLVDMVSSTFEFQGGDVLGTPLIRVAGALVLGPLASGAGAFLIGGASTLSGDIKAGQNVLVQGNNGTGNTTVVAGSDIRVDGTLTLRSQNLAFASNLNLGARVLTVGEGGTLAVELGSGGPRDIVGSVTNEGTVNVSIATNMPAVSASYINRGAWSVTAGTLTFTGAPTFRHEDGVVAVSGAGALHVDSGTFVVAGGSVSGRPRIRGAKLELLPGVTEPAAFLVGALGATQPLLAGTINPAQDVLIQGANVTANTTALVDAEVTVLGLLTLRSADQAFSSSLDVNGHLLHVGPGGRLSVEPGSGGPRAILGEVLNEGTVDVSFGTTMNRVGAQIVNRGQWTVSAASLTVTNGTFTHEAGEVAAAAPFFMDTSTFVMTGGTVSGRPFIRGSTLDIDPAATGAANFHVGALGATQPHLKGTIHDGQDVLIQGASITANTQAIADTDLFIDGLLTLRSDNLAFESSLDLGSHQLVVGITGVVSSEQGSGGPRVIRGDIANEGLVSIAFPTTLPTATATYENRGQWTVTTDALTVSAGSFVHAGGNITVSGVGAMNVDLASFLMTGGTVTGRPRIRGSSLTIDDAAEGAASFLAGALGAIQPRLAGTIHLAQDVLVQGASITTNTTAALNADLVVNGLLTLRSADLAFESSLDTGIHTLIVGASGRVSVEQGTNGPRSILGNIINDGVVDVSFLTTMSRPGATYLNRGAWNVTANTLTVTSGTFTQAGGSVAVSGTGAFHVDTSTFLMTGGTVSGRPRIRGSTLNISADPAAGAGAATFLIGALGAAQPHIVGTIHALHDVLLQGASVTTNTTAIADGDVVVNGLLTLRSADLAFASELNMNGHTLRVGAGGRVSTETGSGGPRSIQGNITNEGTVDILAVTALPTAGCVIANRGTWNVAANALTVTGAGTVLRLEDGSVNVTGAMNVDTITTEVLGGVVTGRPRIRGGTLDIDVGATSPVNFLVGALGAAQPHLRGVIHAGQDVLIQGASVTTNTVAIADEDLVVEGLLALRSADLAFNSSLDLGVHTLFVEDGGLVSSELGSGGPRVISGNIVNNGRVETSVATTYDSGTLTNDVDGDLGGLATMTLNGSFANAGTFAPGTLAAHGALTVSRGVPVTGLAVRLGGTLANQFDRLVVNGATTLSGTLAVSLDAGYTPVVGDSFTVLTATSIAGQFDAFEGIDIQRGLAFAVQQNATTIRLVVTKVASFVVTEASAPISGEPFDLVVEARDPDDLLESTFVGSVTLSSNDPFATLDPGPYTFNVADAGVLTIPGVVLKRAGATVVRVTDVAVPGRFGTAPVEVAPAINGVAPRLVVSGVADGQFVNVPVTLTAAVASDDPILAAALALDGAPLLAGDPVLVTEEGVHTVTLEATDIAGRVATRTFTFTIDLTAPLVSFIGVTVGGLFGAPVSPLVDVQELNPGSLTVTLDGAPFTPGTPVADGVHVLVARAVDLAGNETTESVTFTVDTTAPVITFSGFVEGALNPTAVRPAFAVEDLTATVDVASLDDKPFVPGTLVDDGVHVFLVEATDAVGLRTAAAATFTVDSIAPRVTISGVNEGGRFPIGVSAFVDVEDANLLSVDVRLDGAAYTDGTPINTPGDHVLTVRAEDAAGHVTDVSARFAIIANAPTITVEGVEEGETYSGPVQPIITVDDPEAVLVVTLDGVPYTGGAIVEDGKHTLKVTATNTDGISGSVEIGFTIDSTPPDLVISGVVDGGIYRDPVTPDLVLGSGDTRSVTATLDDEDFVLGTEVSAAGEHVLVVVVTDAAGNEARVVVRFTIDPTAPLLELTGVADGAFVNDDVVIAVSASLADGVPGVLTIEVTLDDVAYTPGATIGAEGRHVVRASALVDGVPAAVAGLTFTIDRTAPVVSVLGVTDGEVRGGPVVIVVEPADAFLGAVLLTVDGAAYTSGTAVTAEGVHVLVVDAVDLAGNRTLQTLSFTIDTTPPVITITAPLEGEVLAPPVIPVATAVDANLATLVVDVDGLILADGEAVTSGGAHVVHAKAVDLAGNVSEASVSFTVLLSVVPQLTVTRLGEPAAGDRVVLYDEAGVRLDAAGTVLDDGTADVPAVPPGRYRARIDHNWQRFFTDVFDVPGGAVLFDIPDEPSYDETLYVDAEAPAGGDGSIAAPFTALTPALEQAGFRTLIKVAGGSYSGAVTVPPGASVRGGHRGGTWAFAPAEQVTTLGAGVEVSDDSELLDVKVVDAVAEGVVATGSALVRDVVVLGAASTGVLVESPVAALVANVLVDGSGGDGVAVNGDDVDLENITIADSAGTGIVVGGARTARLLATGSTVADVDGAGDVLSDGIVFVAGPLHDRYLAQTRAGDAEDSVGVDDGDVDASALDLRGRTTARDGSADVGLADSGYHAWPTPRVEPPVPPPPAGVPPSCGCGASRDGAPLMALAALLLFARAGRGRRRALLVAAVAVVAAAGCEYRFERTEGLSPGDVVGRALHADGGGVASFARIGTGGANVVRRAQEDGSFVVRGLNQGSWLLRLDEDQNGDGRLDRAGLRAVAIRPSPAASGALTSVLLGDVPLGGVVTVTATASRADGEPLTANARAYIVRSAADLTPEELGGVPASELPGLEASADVTAGIGPDGAVTLVDVAPGTFRVLTFDPGDGTTPAAMSAPVVVTAPAGGSVNAGSITLASAVDTRTVQLSIAIPPGVTAAGAGAVVKLVRAGGDPLRPGDVIVESSKTVESIIQLADVPLGAFDLYVEAAPGAPTFHGALLGQLAYLGPEVLQWGPVVVGTQDPCDPVGDVDRDQDGVKGLPRQSDAPELYVVCAASCAFAGAALAEASCEVAGERYDCDDDGDGNADVREPNCVSLCAGTDLDEDGACDRADPDVPVCTPSCEPVDAGPATPDAGPPDAGESDAGPTRAGCSAPVTVPEDGVVAGTLSSSGADDVDGCFDLFAPDAIHRVPLTAGLATMTVSTAGSDFDTVVSVYGAACASANVLGCNDDTGGAQSLVTANDVPAGDVLVVVEGYRGAVGDYRLEVGGTYALGAACDPTRTSFSCPGGACGPDGAGGFKCFPPRDCGDGVDADGDGTPDEDACAQAPVVTCPAPLIVDVLAPAALTASATDDVAVASRQWTIVSAPAGSTVALAGATTDSISFRPVLVGDYVLRYVAADDLSQLSACDVTVSAKTDDVFRVELIWNLGVNAGDLTDLDLHLLHPTAPAWFDGALDCHFANCRAGSLSWQFGAGPDPSPSLDVDDRDGRGPENINLAAPEDVSYRVGVAYFSDRGFGPSDAFVNIFCFGDLAATVGPVTVDVGASPEENEFWKVADVAFAGGACTVTPLGEVVPTSTARLSR